MRLALLLLCIGCGPQVATTETGLIPGTTAGVPGSGGETIRIATWNIEGVGSPGSDEYDALIDVLRRIDADVIGLNEIDIGETSILEDIAAQLGYDTVVVPGTNPFGGPADGHLLGSEVDMGVSFTSTHRKGRYASRLGLEFGVASPGSAMADAGGQTPDTMWMGRLALDLRAKELLR